MKLYHGTSDKNLDNILLKGILPRGRGKGNWKHSIDSNSKCVYLTDTYGLYFAMVAAKDSGKGALIEIDTEKLDPFGLLPDEDALEQIGRKFDTIKGTIHERTKFYRSILHNYSGSLAWKKSLEALGNCSYMGIIPPDAITRISTLDMKGLWLAVDPTITLINQMIMGDYYKALTAKCFGDSYDHLDIISGKDFVNHWEPENLEIITV